MAERSSRLFFFLLLIYSAKGFRLGQWGTLISLSHSLMSRVANAREARQDHAGADRARKIAERIHRFRGGRGLWSTGWDFAWNYAWQGGIPASEIYRSTVDILGAISEFQRCKSGEERTGWVLRSYPRLLGLSKSLLKTLLRSFSRSGPIREAVLLMQREIVEGELLRDCLDVGAADLEGLLRIVRDMFYSAYSNYNEL
ncbi:hypothetical protein AXF42_Ash000436 [Apostasia shenzhenica]|uniref:Uncharacterized protein n=1 Tax=Apostasia shenzhenica TaxID=1088818 RepID=A0A2I0AGC3_9ASPA|nr:hypothetical protein AXF42_Ash000436 [Apostasia shenzhenica]